MITLQTITGLLIAAALLVQGTGQREVTKVENEPVVKETHSEAVKQQDERWFLVNISGGNQNLPENQMIQAGYDGDISTPCPGSQQICAVRLSYDASDPSVEALLDQIETSPNTVSVADFDGLPADVLLYAHQNP